MNQERSLDFSQRTERLLNYLCDQYPVGSSQKIYEIRRLCEDIVNRGSEYDFFSDWHVAQYQSALEFLTVCEFYRKRNIIVDQRLMKKVCSGRLVFPNEEGISQDRDFFYELKTARYFWAAGFEVDLTTDADLLASRANIRIHVECKRLWSEKNARKQIRRANKQIQNRLGKSNKKSVGWIFVDASHLINEGKIPYPYRNLLAAMAGVRAELTYLCADILGTTAHKEDWSASYLVLSANWTAISISEKEPHPLTTTMPFRAKRWRMGWERKCINALGKIASEIDYLESSAIVSK